jgi:hypothetical protein
MSTNMSDAKHLKAEKNILNEKERIDDNFKNTEFPTSSSPGTVSSNQPVQGGVSNANLNMPTSDVTTGLSSNSSNLGMGDKHI